MVVEKRTFISKAKYIELMNMFTSTNVPIKQSNQIIYKYKSELDFRLIFESNSAYLRLRGCSNISEDLIVNIDPHELSNLKIMFRNLGMSLEVKWYRKRFIINYEDYLVTIDETYHYGYVISISKTVNDPLVENTKEELTRLFAKLSISIISSLQFNDRYKNYKIEWVDKLSNIDEDKFLNMK